MTTTGGAQASLNIASELSMPSREAEERMPIRRSEWHRLRKQADTLTHPIPNASHWVAFSLGLATSAFFAWLPWRVVYEDGLTDAQKLKWAWVSPLMLVVVIAALLFALCFYRMNKKVSKDLKQRNQSFCAEMDDIEKMHPAH